MRHADRQAADAILQAMQSNWPEAVTPVSRLMIRVYRLSTLVLDNATEQVAIHGLSFMEFEVLVALRSADRPHELTPKNLHQSVLITSGGLTKVLHGLEDRQLISRPADAGDRRSKPVRLTAKGRAKAEKAMADVLRSDGDMIFGGLSDREVEQLIRLLRKLLVRLEGEDTTL